MKRYLALLLLAGPVLSGCSGSDSPADIAACKEAMNTSTTGAAQWSADKSTRPERCKDLSDEAFSKASAEWYDEFNKKLAEEANK